MEARWYMGSGGRKADSSGGGGDGDGGGDGGGGDSTGHVPCVKS